MDFQSSLICILINRTSSKILIRVSLKTSFIYCCDVSSLRLHRYFSGKANGIVSRAVIQFNIKVKFFMFISQSSNIISKFNQLAT